MTKKKTTKTNQEGARNEPNLDSRYGEIGISAVAAALKYKTKAETPAPQRTAAIADKWADAAAA
jgi:hypothetical protein